MLQHSPHYPTFGFPTFRIIRHAVSSVGVGPNSTQTAPACGQQYSEATATDVLHTVQATA
jgi:hypothetical protein